jgi:hypothetical protein
MRKTLWFAAIAVIFVLSARSSFAQESQPQQGQQTSEPSSASAPASQTASQAPAQQDSLAAAARKARDQKKEAPKAAKVFDNDSIPTTGGVSTVGATPAQPGDGTPNASGATPAASGNDEKTWRDRFATLHHKLDQDQAELAVLEREYGVSSVQFYTDPMKELQQKLTNDELYKKTLAIDAKKKAIEADKQAISDAEDALRKAGGDSGWAR